MLIWSLDAVDVFDIDEVCPISSILFFSLSRLFCNKKRSLHYYSVVGKSKRSLCLDHICLILRLVIKQRHYHRFDIVWYHLYIPYFYSALFLNRKACYQSKISNDQSHPLSILHSFLCGIIILFDCLQKTRRFVVRNWDFLVNFGVFFPFYILIIIRISHSDGKNWFFFPSKFVYSKKSSKYRHFIPFQSILYFISK